MEEGTSENGQITRIQIVSILDNFRKGIRNAIVILGFWLIQGISHVDYLLVTFGSKICLATSSKP
jgi:hypothetical protein